TTTETPKQYTIGRLLGSGGYGRVYLCCDSSTSILFAMKQVDLGNLNSHISKEVQALINEVQILRKIQHERIVQYLGCQENKESLSIFLEYMPGGSLLNHMQQFGPLTEAVAGNCTKQILEGLVFLHKNNIVHRDIKAANILRDTVGNIKLTDFGVSRQLLSISCASGLNTTIGSPYWMAPEVIKEAGYGQNADLWSVGCTVVEMLTTKPPFYHLEPCAAIYKIVTCKYPDYELPAGTSDIVKNFLNTAFQLNSSKRKSASELLHHSFITDNSVRESREVNMAQSKNNFKRILKVVALGSVYSGKSCLIHRYVHREFKIVYSTIGANLSRVMLGNDQFDIWDTNGLAEFVQITSQFCKDAGAAILVFALNSRKSFDLLKETFEPLLKFTATNSPKVVVGTKLDDPKREVSKEDGEEYARQLNTPENLERMSQVPYFETSSLRNENVKEMFEFVFKHCLLERKTEPETWKTSLKNFFFRS
ncbi:GTPase IMAP family member, partial [Biomphalaria pfeifferi]